MIGIISLDSHQPGIFTQAHAERLQVFADQAAIAIQNARLYEELSRHADELAVLYRGTSFLFTSLSTLTDLSEISQQIAEAVVREFKQVDLQRLCWSIPAVSSWCAWAAPGTTRPRDSEHSTWMVPVWFRQR